MVPVVVFARRVSLCACLGFVESPVRGVLEGSGMVYIDVSPISDRCIR